MSKPVTIDIILDGKLFGHRTWFNVPRVGDTLMLQGGKLATVRRAVWAEAGNDSHYYDCWVQLICDPAKDIKATP